MPMMPLTLRPSKRTESPTARIVLDQQGHAGAADSSERPERKVGLAPAQSSNQE
jgi:hypothetical protein